MDENEFKDRRRWRWGVSEWLLRSGTKCFLRDDHWQELYPLVPLCLDDDSRDVP